MRTNTVALAVLMGIGADIALAQTGAPPEGIPLEGVVVDRSGAGVTGATITFFTRQAVRYQASSDSSGVFRIASMEQGVYEAMIEKTGFVVFPKDPVQVGGGANPVRLRYEMQLGSARQAKLSGRVLNSQDKPAANAQIDLIVSPELWRRTITDADGRFAFDKINPGAYELRAAPPNGSTTEVATYFPSSIDEAGAQRIVVRGIAEVDGFRLQTAPVFRVKGVVRDDNGPAARVNVKLVPMTQQPARVVSSFGPYFLAMDVGLAPGPDESRTVTEADGSFEFPSVRAGDWRIVAEAAPATDPRTGFNLTPSGVEAVVVRESNILNVKIGLASPFTLTGSLVTWPVAQCYDPGPPETHLIPGTLTTVVLCAVDARPAPVGIVYPIWFHALDGQSGILTAAVTQPDGMFVLQPVHAGRYLIKPLPALANPAVTNGHVEDYSRPTIRGPVGPRREPVDLQRNFGPVQLNGGGVFDPDGTRPVQPALLAGPGDVQGTVENGAGAAVVLVWELWTQNAEDALGQFVLCQPDGTFDARRLAPGNYLAAAFRGLDLEGLRAPEVLARVVSTGTKVQVKAGSSTEVRLTAGSWPQ